MQIRAFPLFAAVLLLALVAEAGADQDWKKFTSEEGRFSISVPAQPVKSETSQKSFIGTVTNHVFTSESGKDDSFTVDYSDIPHFALHFAGADTIYEHAKGALLKQTFGKATAYSDVSALRLGATKSASESPSSRRWRGNVNSCSSPPASES
jgi:hypothetical protein